MNSNSIGIITSTKFSRYIKSPTNLFHFSPLHWQGGEEQGERTVNKYPLLRGQWLATFAMLLSRITASFSVHTFSRESALTHKSRFFPFTLHLSVYGEAVPLSNICSKFIQLWGNLNGVWIFSESSFPWKFPLLFLKLNVKTISERKTFLILFALRCILGFLISD